MHVYTYPHSPHSEGTEESHEEGKTILGLDWQISGQKIMTKILYLARCLMIHKYRIMGIENIFLRKGIWCLRVNEQITILHDPKILHQI